MSVRASALCIILCACGSGDEPAKPLSDLEADCLNCGGSVATSPIPALSRSRTLSVYPESLEFYFEADDDEMPELAAKHVVIKNATDFDAEVLAVRVVDDPQAPGGAAYFGSAIVSGDLIAGVGEAALEVAFTGSTRRQVAQVVVQTDHPNVAQIVVPVSGKVFVDAAW